MVFRNRRSHSESSEHLISSESPDLTHESFSASHEAIHEVQSTSALVAEDPEDRCISRSSSSNNSTGIQLKKQLSLLDGVGILVGIMVGSGIFISPTGVVQYAGSVGMSLVIWAITGILSTIGALCYAELGTMIPKSGAEYAYITDSFGSLPGFLFLWVSLLVISPTGNTVMALTFSYYILQPLFGHCVPEIALRLIAALLITALTYINCVNVKLATKIQDIFTVTKIFALLVIIGTGIYALATGHTGNYQQPFEGSNFGLSSLATAFYQGLFSFAGWNCLNFVVEELKDPYKNLPRAILISLPLVTLIYFLTNVAYFAVLTPEEILASNAVAVTFGNRMLGVMAWIIPVFVACSTFGSLNGGIFASSRLFFVGAREGELPEVLSLINVNFLTPVPSLLFLGFMTTIMLVSSDVQVLINYVSFTESVFIGASIAALLWNRYKYPERKRPIKIWIGFPIVFLIVCVFLMVLPIVERPVEIGIAIAIILAGVPVHYFLVAREFKSEKGKKIKASITSTIQLLTQSLPQDREEAEEN